MAAIAYPSSVPTPRPAPTRRRRSSGAHLAVVVGAPSAPRTAPAVYRRRRVVALVLAAMLGAALILGLRAAAGALGGAPLAPSAPPAAAEAQPVVAASYVVQPGDTYWSIAHSLQLPGDPRAAVDRLVAAQHGAPLRAGERITVP